MRALASFVLAATLALAPVAGWAKPVPVLATVGMIGDLASDIGGDCALVETLVPPGADPHLFRPRPSDLRRLMGAEVVFHLGLNLEGRLGDVLAGLPGSVQVVELGQSIPPDLLLDDDGAPDPHLWMEPGLWAQILPPIAETLAKSRPDCAEGFAQRAQDMAAQLEALSAWAAESFASIPENARVLVTAHDAFGYLARAYGLREEAIQGFSTESEAAVADIRAVAQVVIETGVPVVFIETTINPRTIQALVEAVTAAGGSVAIGEPLFSDSMGPEGTPEGSYIGMIRANVLAITQGLGGTPADWPEALAPWAARWNISP